MEKLIVANWKMNPHSPQAAMRLGKAIDQAVPRRGVKVVIAPPFPYLAILSRILKNSLLGAQDLFWEQSGARTGEVSGHQLKHFGVKYVIVGHSERRALGENDLAVNKKVKAALKDRLNVILCVGEPWSVRKISFAVAKKFVAEQIKKALRGLPSFKFNAKIIIAYEPVWAIGTGRADRPEEAAAMARFIKELLFSKFSFPNPKVLYGGSVNSKNARSFLGQKEIDGTLVGGASIRPSVFRKIIDLAVPR
jgi:triosephosphate isomerase